MSGWIKLHRSLLEWEWYDDHNTKMLFIHCLLMANHKDRSYKGKLIKRGSFVTGFDVLASQLGLSVRQIRTAITKLESTGELTRTATSKGQTLTLIEYDKYQSQEPEATSTTTSGATNQRQASDKLATSERQLTRRKEGKNEKNERTQQELLPSVESEKTKRTNFKEPTVQEVHEYAITRDKNFNDAETFCDFYSSKGWVVGKNKMKDWKAAVRNWMRGKTYSMTAATPVIDKASIPANWKETFKTITGSDAPPQWVAVPDSIKQQIKNK